MRQLVTKHGRSEAESGATAVEYAIMLGAIAAVVILTVFALGLSTEDLFGDLASRWQP
jgi:Flp pilus assembly pilin Flp